MTLSVEIAKLSAIACVGVLLGLELLPRFLLVPTVSCGALQLWSLQEFLRVPKTKKIDDNFTGFRAAIVQVSCDRQVLSILAAVVLITFYLALGDSVKSSWFLLNAATKSAIAFSLGALCSAALPQENVEEEIQSACSCGMNCGSLSGESCPYSTDFWSDFEVPEKASDTNITDISKDLIDVLFLKKTR
mmetsp:Transcript_118470/g.166574  ORF Transcript_118470/g.166574 Transcript_118470/m.166574 type:complete len:189 (-) Transcript_118470:42-608(-)|eukprot:symbB.v1.2.023996.t1/scaffold2228.1/size107706/8